MTLTVTVTVALPASDSTLSLVRGDDYFSADGASLDFTYTGAPSLTGATAVKLTLRHRLTGTTTTFTGSVVSSSVLRFELAATDTGPLTVGEYDYDVQVTLLDGHVRTLTRGRGVVLQDYTA